MKTWTSLRALAAAAALVGCAGDEGASEATGASAGSTGTSGGGTSGGATETSGASEETAAGEACAGEATRAGEATYYAADGSGNCSFPPTPGDLRVAALNDADYMNAAWCGACARVVGPSGEVTVRIVDRCPGCASGDLDLSESAFAAIAAPELGRVPISWRFVPCAGAEELRFHFKEGSSEWWTAVQVRGHRHAIASFEYSKDGVSFTSVARESYNYFVEPAGMGAGALTFRVRDAYGGEVVAAGIAVGSDVEVGSGAQLPVCGG